MPTSITEQAPGHVVPDLPPDLHALDYVAFLLKRKWLVAACVILSTAAFLGATYIMPYTYTSQARILPPDRISSAGLLNSLNASGALRMLKEIENPSVDLIQNLIESRTIAVLVARDSMINAFYRQNASDDPASEIARSIVVEPNFARVDVISHVSTGWFSDAKSKEQARALSARVVVKCLSAMDSVLTTHLQGDSKQHLDYAEKDFAANRAQLDSLEGVIEQFERTNGIVQLKEQTTQAIVQLAALKAEQLQAEGEAAALAGDFANTSKRRSEASNRVMAARVAVDRYKNQPDFSLAFNELPDVGREYASLLVKVRTLEPVVIYLQHELEQARIDNERRRSLITLLDPAQVPEVRSSPKRVPMLMLGLFSGFVLSILVMSTQSMLRSWGSRPRA